MPVIQSIKSPRLHRFSIVYQYNYFCLSTATITELIGLLTLDNRGQSDNSYSYSRLPRFVSNVAFYNSVVYNLLDLVVSVCLSLNVSARVIYALRVSCEYTQQRSILRKFALLGSNHLTKLSFDNISPLLTKYTGTHFGNITKIDASRSIFRHDQILKYV